MPRNVIKEMQVLYAKYLASNTLEESLERAKLLYSEGLKLCNEDKFQGQWSPLGGLYCNGHSIIHYLKCMSLNNGLYYLLDSLGDKDIISNWSKQYKLLGRQATDYKHGCLTSRSSREFLGKSFTLNIELIDKVLENMNNN